MAIAPNIRLDDLKNKFKKFPNLKYALVRLVLFKIEDNREYWSIYYCNLALLENKPNIGNKILYQNEKIVIAEFVTERREVDYFINGIEGKSAYNIRGFFERYEINSIVGNISEYFLTTDVSKNMGLDFPCEEIRLGLPVKGIEKIKLTEYRYVNELIKEKLGINLDKCNGLQYILSFCFEKGLGGIKEVDYKYNLLTSTGRGSELKISLDFNEGQKQYYALRLFLDRFSQKPETQIKNLDINKEITYPLEFRPDKIVLRLIYKDILVDEYTKILEKEETEDLGSSLSLFNIYPYKRQATELKSEIKVPMNVDFGLLVEQKLNDAEQKLELDPKDALQALSEAMESLCEDYCQVVGLKKEGKVGLSLHTRVFRHWESTTKLPIINLLYQTGMRHVIKMGSLKKHHAKIYEPNKFEVAYLIELAWKGYYEIIKMIKEVQDILSSYLKPQLL